MLVLAAVGCSKKKSEAEAVPVATKSVDDSESARAVLALAEATALVKAEAALQAVVEGGTAEAFLDKGRALEAAGKALAEKIPRQAYETPLPDKLYQTLGMIAALEPAMAENPEVRKRFAGTVHRNLAAVFALEPLPYVPITTVKMSLRRFCTVLAAGLAQAGAECGAEAKLPPCCEGAGCDEPLTLDLEKIELCNQMVVSAACAGKLTALPASCTREALLKSPGR